MFRADAGGGGMLDKKDLMTYKWKLLSKAMLDPALTHADNKCLLNILERYNKKTGIAWPSFKGLAKDVSISVQQAQISIKRLDKNGYIHITRGTRTTSNKYTPLFGQVKDWTTGWCDKKEGMQEKLHTPMQEELHTGMQEELHLTSFNKPISINTHRKAASVCKDSDFNFKKKKDSVHCQTLTDEQLKYIKFKVASKSGKVDDLGAYEAKLVTRAMEGRLVLTDFEELRAEYHNRLLGNYTAETMNSWTADQAADEIRSYLQDQWEERQIEYEGEQLTLSGAAWEHYLKEYHQQTYYRIHIDQRISEGVSVEDIIKKVLNMKDIDLQRYYSDILMAEYPEQWEEQKRIRSEALTNELRQRVKPQDTGINPTGIMLENLRAICMKPELDVSVRTQLIEKVASIDKGAANNLMDELKSNGIEFDQELEWLAAV